MIDIHLNEYVFIYIDALFVLVLLFVVSLRIDFGKIISGIEEEVNERRGPPPNPVEIAVRNSIIIFMMSTMMMIMMNFSFSYQLVAKF